ncbi:amino acid adenylation domain-containing protein [Streptomyces sp. NPDC047821]|uniref:amino acid adenylation domain-containing protein n=1 Tax=Streptomyces sp. NPDC047821 TaxID=3365488 RepID=UPI00371C1CE1
MSHTQWTHDPAARRAAVYRLPAGTSAADCRAALRAVPAPPDGPALPDASAPPDVPAPTTAPTTAPAPAGGPVVRFWAEAVPGAAGSAVASRRRERELRAPLGVAGTVRLVLLEYADGVRDLVAVTDAEDGVLDRLAEALGAVDAPNDGTGAAGPGLDVPGIGAGPDVAADVAAVLLLALARARREEQPVLDVVEHTAGGVRTGCVRAAGLDEDLPVAAYRAWVAEQAARPGGEGGEDTGDGPRVALHVDLRPRAVHALRRMPPLEGRHALTVHVTSGADGTPRVRCWYGAEEFPVPRAEALRHRVERLARQVLTGDQALPVAALAAHDAAEERRIVDLGRTARVADSGPRLIHELVRASAAASPDATALTDPGDGTALTYRQLVERGDRLAGALHALGVRPGDRVGVCLDRSARLIEVLLGVLAAGAAYVPLDPAYPADRLAFVEEDARLGVVIVEDGRGGAFAPGAAVELSALTGLAATAPPLPPGTGASPDDAAYVIYTSGSTGRPKGVVVPHRAVGRLLDATADDFGLGPGDCWTWFHSVAFDFSVWEIWGCLGTGGRLVVVPYWTCRSPEDFRELLLRERVTVLNQTPSAFARLTELEHARPAPLALRLVVFGGEPLDARSLVPWFDVHPERECRMVNMFGITETTVHVTARTVTRADALAGSRSVGAAIPGWSVRVLDERGRLLPPGCAGEIAVGGDGLALEYLGRPELTERRFVPDPLDPRGRLYLSGDKGRMLPDGQLEHLGRLDNQIKLRGHRIELDEIRSVLLAHPSVRAAVVVLNAPPGRPDDATLDAYAVLDGADAREVRRHAARMLPEYMVPSTVTALARLPLTVNGKVDTAQLPVPRPAPVRRPPRRAEGGTGPLEAVLEAWRTAFGEEVSPDDDFFDLGGNSLRALRVVHALRDAGVRVDVRDVYRLRTPSALAGAATVVEPGAAVVA